MRKRPRSSVTTSLANFVGRSLVSAMTQTPASGPFAPVTTPAMSFAPALPVPCVLRQAVRSAARALATTPKYKIFLIFMNPPLDAAEGRDGSLIIRSGVRWSHAFARIRMHLSVRLGKRGGRGSRFAFPARGARVLGSQRHENHLDRQLRTHHSYSAADG